MNCWPGALALVTVGVDAGMAVTCIAVDDAVVAGVRVPGLNWRIDRGITWFDGNRPDNLGKWPFCPDKYLRPIGGERITSLLREEAKA